MYILILQLQAVEKLGNQTSLLKNDIFSITERIIERVLNDVKDTLGEAISGSTDVDFVRRGRYERFNRYNIKIEIRFPENTINNFIYHNSSEKLETYIESRVIFYLSQSLDLVSVQKVMIVLDRTQESQVAETSSSKQEISLQIDEEPLTAQNLTTITSALLELHTKCWLIEQERFDNLITYTQFQNPLPSQEVPLVVAQITHNSPTLLRFIPYSKNIAEALTIAIDAVIRIPVRFQRALLENRLKASEIRIKEQKAAAEQISRTQLREIEAQKAEIAMQKELLELEKELLQIEKDRFEFNSKRYEYLTKTARKMVEELKPNAAEGMKTMLSQALVSSLAQLSNSNDIKLILPESKTDNTESIE